MNRRDFVKALAGIALLRLLVKLPEAEEELHLTMRGDPGYMDCSIGSTEATILFGSPSAEPAPIDTIFATADSELRWAAGEQPTYNKEDAAYIIFGPGPDEEFAKQFIMQMAQQIDDEIMKH